MRLPCGADSDCLSVDCGAVIRACPEEGGDAADCASRARVHILMKLSIVTSLYRSAPYIREFQRRSLEAIRASGASSYEIIFVNDGSPDDSLASLRALLKAMPMSL